MEKDVKDIKYVRSFPSYEYTIMRFEEAKIGGANRDVPPKNMDINYPNKQLKMEM